MAKCPRNIYNRVHPIVVVTVHFVESVFKFFTVNHKMGFGIVAGDAGLIAQVGSSRAKCRSARINRLVTWPNLI